ncbi:MAG: hypothetical protein Q7S83_01405, partial [bacterium]|nr:hypothetical protein [bacterium]
LDFEQLADLPIEQFQKDIDAAMEEVVSLDVIDKVRKFEIGNKAFSKLRAQLNDHLVREVLGSKGKKETRELINHILKNEMHRLIQEKKEGYKEKLVYLKVIAADLIGS